MIANVVCSDTYIDAFSRLIFTQSGNTVLLVYIDHHDAAYLWASNRLKGFETSNIKSAHEYFEQSQKDTSDSSEDKAFDFAYSNKTIESTIKPKTEELYEKNETPATFLMPVDDTQESMPKMPFGLFSRVIYILLGIIIGIIITILHFM